MSVMFVVKQGGEHPYPNLARECCWDSDRSWKKLIFSRFVCLKIDILCENVRRICVLWKMGPLCILVTIGRKSWSQSVIISLIRINGLNTASSLLKRWGGKKKQKNKPCDTDTGNEWSVRRAPFYYLLSLLAWFSDICYPSFNIASFTHFAVLHIMYSI